MVLGLVLFHGSWDPEVQAWRSRAGVLESRAGSLDCWMFIPGPIHPQVASPFCALQDFVHTSVLSSFWNHFILENDPPETQNGAQMEPEWLPEIGFYDFTKNLLPCNTTSFLLDVLVFRIPNLPQEPQQMYSLLCPNPKTHKIDWSCDFGLF